MEPERRTNLSSFDPLPVGVWVLEAKTAQDVAAQTISSSAASGGLLRKF